ncbi:hypothetical protein [Ekhidna sp.]|uniref:hypothetical protein n=1 Tax=Ekhidna sp. TaxID=2608089 RepID=UPI003CCBF5B9
MKRLITVMLLIQIFGCEQQSSNHPVFKYFPPENVFEDGYVSKYYYHYYPDNPDKRAGTEIRYTKYVKLDDTHYLTENYNAGYDLVSTRHYLVEGDSIVLEKGFGINAREVTDTTEMKVLDNNISVWESEAKSPYRVSYTFGDEEYIYTEHQASVADTVIDNNPAKAFYSIWNYKNAVSDSIVSEGESTSYYVKDLGFFGSMIIGSDYSRHIELVEQMSIEEFEKRANHGEHRVAWIDPENTISDDSDFSICDHERRIADYYNSTPSGEYIHSKRALLDTVFSNLDKSKLFDQSGRLVFRFVVNCEGRAGRFIAEGYDLDYQTMEFDPETVDHLFGILQKLEAWRPVVLNDKPRDAYFYITFNIENGEIIDILP